MYSCSPNITHILLLEMFKYCRLLHYNYVYAISVTCLLETHHLDACIVLSEISGQTSNIQLVNYESGPLLFVLGLSQYRFACFIYVCAVYVISSHVLASLFTYGLASNCNNALYIQPQRLIFWVFVVGEFGRQTMV